MVVEMRIISKKKKNHDGGVIGVRKPRKGGVKRSSEESIFRRIPVVLRIKSKT